MNKKRPNPTFMGWLGRQVGHVRKAIKTKPNQPQARSHSKKPAPAAEPPSAVVEEAPGPSQADKVIYREDKIEEAELPDQPGVVFRRTVIDEIVVKQEEPGRGTDSRSEL